MLKSVSGVALLAACVLAPLAQAADSDWPAHGGDAFETNYSRLDEVKGANVDRLGLAWSLDLPGETSLEGTPLAVRGVLYATGSYATVYAVDAASGKLLWNYDPQTWKINPGKMLYSFAVNRGAAFDNGRVFVATLDGRLVALDARTGKPDWSVQTVPPDSPQTITAAPRTFGGKVIIGNGGADFGARGFVTAYDQATGKQAWRFYVVPGTAAENAGDPALQRAASTWKGPYWKTGTGGGVWDSITYDPDFNRIYLGTGNAGPQDPDRRSPGGGDNLYTASIVALDADTGKYVWHYQLVPRDAWDYDCTQQMTLADLTIAGLPRKVLMQAPKDGFFYVLDRATGRPISAEKLGKVTWASHIDLATGRPVEVQGMRYESGTSIIWPSASGAHSWQSMSFSPKTGLVYIPYMSEGMRLTRGPARAGEFNNGGVSIGLDTSDPMNGKAFLAAWNPVTQSLAWKVPQAAIWNGGTLATAGGLVFQGTADGNLDAYDASDGKMLWHAYAGMGIMGAPISFAVAGRQYISVLAGYGGAAAIGGSEMKVGWTFAAPRRLLTFALDSHAALPPTPPRYAKLAPVDKPSLKLDPAQVEAGRTAFMSCAICHGRDAIGAGGPAPDLRESRIALEPDSLWTVVHDGTLLANGMPRFPQLTRDQVTQIYAYIRARARAAL